ncbi:serine/threonine protein phosphatase 4 regulatory subunit-like protein [Leptotrombidium deliense]|uniref:Serine/threonine protein phosphatase 4 regulatory subunit-like protein n=1 Tax=Leptotrombidium deliense TaxID=299467 RepID=A0A443SLJ9_9ACAR|nr:serine/threonine protein phosphatase 4 regulatory subunit-like protein [Leptotrombidium deliense]
MELNKELVFDALTDFENKNSEISKIPDNLEKYLLSVAKTGDTLYPWSKIKYLLRKKIELVVNEFNEKFPANNVPDLPNVKSFDFVEMKKDILEIVDAFCGSPFTIQRICELLTAPYKHYKRIDKFMRGLEKNVLVVTTIEPKSAKPEVSNINHKSLFVSTSSMSYQSASSSSSYVNGISDNGSHGSLSVEYCSTSRLSMSPSSPSSPAPLQQLDSFTTVFASPPSTPLAVVSDMNTYDSTLSSSSSSSSSSSESSPQPMPSSPPSMSSSVTGVEKMLNFNEAKLESSDDEKDSMNQCIESEPMAEMKSNEMLFDELREKSSDKIVDEGSEEESEDKSDDSQNAFPDNFNEEDMSITESGDRPVESLEMESEASIKESKSEECLSEVNNKEANEEIRLITEHLKDTVASAPESEQMDENESSFD